jgi:hypothetical protein
VTPNELYARTPVAVVADNLDALKGCYYDHLPEIDVLAFELAPIIEGPMKGRFELRYYRRFCSDGRRIWHLYSLWFDGRPVMILQNAGREGDDHHRRIVTDVPRLASAISSIRTFLGADKVLPEEIADPSHSVLGLDTFYGGSLQDGEST